VPHEPFSIEVVARALGSSAVSAVTVVETFAASDAQVARLQITFSDGRAPLRAIGKAATGTGVAAARRELRFFQHTAPLWDSRAPQLLGAWDEGLDGDTRVLLLTEDLGAAGYAVVGGDVSDDQLGGAIDALVALHARFWEACPAVHAAIPAPSVTRAAQAWPPDVIAVHAAAARAAATRFTAAHATALVPHERALLDEISTAWESQFFARTAGGHAITLIHGDFHVLGNLFFAREDPRPRVIDWSELKPGLGPHDLAYCLIAVPSGDRATRDLALLRRYWEHLRGAGVERYTWELCRWDHRLSLITNVFQSLFQDSVTWFRRTAAIIDALDCRAALRDPPPCP